MASLRHAGSHGLRLSAFCARCASKSPSLAMVARPQARSPARLDLPTRRSYASQPAPDAVDKRLFNPKNYPLRMFRMISISSPERVPQRLSPQQYHDVTTEFCKAAASGSNPSTIDLTNRGFAAQDMYEAGCVLYAAGLVPMVVDMMWLSASGLGCAPATLSFTRRIVKAKLWGQTKRPEIRRVEAQFLRMARQSPDSNVLLVDGERHVSQGNTQSAMHAFQRALELDTPGFEWKPACQLALALIYSGLGRRQQAIGLLEAVVDLDIPAAHLHLGKMLRSKDRDKAEHHLQRAAMGASHEACAYLAEIAWEKSLETSVPKQQESWQSWAAEWSNIAKDLPRKQT